MDLAGTHVGGPTHRHLIIMVDSGCRYLDRRQAIRQSWKLLHQGPDSPLTETERQSVDIWFVVGQDPAVQAQVAEEAATYGDVVQTNVPDSYDTILRKMLEFLKLIAGRYTFDYFMHADDDSFVRLDALLAVSRQLPRERLYWGYAWNVDASSPRWTRPLRDPTAKSFMPFEQHAEDSYPPFASGCGFLLSYDLATYLAQSADQLPDYRYRPTAQGSGGVIAAGGSWSVFDGWW